MVGGGPSCGRGGGNNGFDPTNRQILMSTVGIRCLLVFAWAVGPEMIENVLFLVDNMIPSHTDMVNMQAASQNQMAIPSSHMLTKACSITLPCLKRLTKFGYALGPPEVNIGFELTSMVGWALPQGISSRKLTSGAPQTPPNAAKHFNVHGRVLPGALVSLGWSYYCV